MHFKRLRHQKIALILASLDAKKLLENHCYFGGGTAIVLRFGEYRESVDIDLMVSNKEGYRQLRSDATDPGGLGNLFKSDCPLDLSNEVRADQYGIRSFIQVLDSRIKFEIVLEGRIAFDQPSQTDSIMGVACLTTSDLLASKLLANSDRWGDASVFGRDLIDMAMMKFNQDEWRLAYQKAQSAYGQTIKNDLLKAINWLVDNQIRLRQCMKNLKIEITEAELVEKIRALKKLTLE